MADQKILDKISKLLALSESDNANEAAIALARAQKLMQEHSVTMTDISLSSITEHKESMPSMLKDSRLYTLLGGIVGRSFGVKQIYNFETKGTRNTIKGITFIGPEDRTATAGYVFTVIARQLAIAKKIFLAKYRQQLLEEYNKQVREQLFYNQSTPFTSLSQLYKNFPFVKYNCESRIRKAVKAYLGGWLASVYQKVEDFAYEEHETLLIQQYLDVHYPDLGSVKNRRLRLNQEQYSHFNQGLKDGEDNIKLFHGVSGDMRRKEIGYN